MAFLSLTLSALMAAVPAPGPPDVTCLFAARSGVPPLRIELRLAARPHAAGNFPVQIRPVQIRPVQIRIGDRRIPGAVSALTQTEQRDVLVRGMSAEGTLWLIAIRDTGAAYLQARVPAPAPAPVPAGRTGTCMRQGPALDVWLLP